LQAADDDDVVADDENEEDAAAKADDSEESEEVENADEEEVSDESDDSEEHDHDDMDMEEEHEDDADEDMSFVQKSRNIDDDNAEAAEMARMEDETDKLEGEDDSSADDASNEEDSDDDESFVQVKSEWKPEPDSGVKLYEHPQGSTVVMPCPVKSQVSPESCSAYYGEKADGEQCPQITCPKALGVTMKLTCSGGCCPTCWAPDHVIAVDRHTSIDDAAVVDPAPQAPTSCSGVKCFKLNCGPGFTEGFVNGNCCYSCVPGR